MMQQESTRGQEKEGGTTLQEPWGNRAQNVEVAARVSSLTRIPATSVGQGRGEEGWQRRPQRGSDHPTGYSESSTSSGQSRQREKRPNQSFRGVRYSEGDTSKQGEVVIRDGLVGSAVRTQRQRGLNWEGWMQREQLRGHDSSPNTSEFSDLNDLSMAKNIHLEREVVRYRELRERNPSAWLEVESRLLRTPQDQEMQQYVASETLAPTPCNAVQEALAQPQFPDNALIFPNSQHEQPTRPTPPLEYGIQEQLPRPPAQGTEQPIGTHQEIRSGNVMDGRHGPIFMFGEQQRINRGIPSGEARSTRGMPNLEVGPNNQLVHLTNQHVQQAPGRGEAESSQIQLAQV
jgi:hypothetical protein